MAPFVIGCLLGAAFVAAVAVPFLAPWPFRVRYLANSQSIDQLSGLTPTPRHEMHVVVLQSFRLVAERAELELGYADTGRHRPTFTLEHTGCKALDIAKLDAWSSLFTPLLMVTEADQSVHLFGPDGAIVDLAASKERAQ